MTTKTNNVKLGAFIILGTGLFVILMVIFGAGAFLDKGTEFETYFDSSVDGLSVGSPVKFRGVRIGEVCEIGFVGDYYDVVEPERVQLVLVRMELDAGAGTDGEEAVVKTRIDQYVESGMRLRIVPQGITGLSYVSAEYIEEGFITGEIDVAWEPDAIYIPSIPNRLMRISNSIESIAHDLQGVDFSRISSNLDKLISLTQDRFEEIDLSQLSATVNATASSLEQNLVALNKIVSHPDFIGLRESVPATVLAVQESMKQFDETLATAQTDFSMALTELQTVTNSIQTGLESEDAEQTFLALQQLSTQLPGFVADLDLLVGRLDSVLEENETDISGATRNINEFSAKLDELSDMLRRYPASAIRSNPPAPLEIYEDNE